MAILILTLIAIAIFASYNATVVTKLGVPTFLGETFYALNVKKEKLGLLYTAFTVILAGLVVSGCVDIIDHLPDWRSNFTFVSYFAGLAILFSGTAPVIREKSVECEKPLMYKIVGLVGALLAVLWVVLVSCTAHDWWVILLSLLGGLGASLAVGLTKKTFKETYVYLAELFGYTSLLVSLFINSIVYF